MYADQRVAHGLPAATPWDIGGPQPVVQQLVALGAARHPPGLGGGVQVPAGTKRKQIELMQ
jgi:hypothetical protein